MCNHIKKENMMMLKLIKGITKMWVVHKKIVYTLSGFFAMLILPVVGCFAQNPFVTDIFTADPSAHVWQDGRLYVYPSHDIAPPRGCDLMDQYHVYSTDDMVNWTDHGEILRASQVPWGRKEGGFMWAPDCAYKNGTYYFYFPHPSDTKWNSSWKIGVATSKKPASDFTVQGFIPGLESMIDPCVFTDDDGQSYFYYGGGGRCKGGKLKDNMMEIDGEMKDMEGLVDFHEATWVHKRNGIYYLSYSDNHDDKVAQTHNQMMYATSKSPLGPWTHMGIYMDPTDSYTNHGSIVEYKGQWYSFYHNSALSSFDWLRSICVDKIYYNPDGTIQKVIPTGIKGTGIPYTTFKGEKTTWHGFDRYDFLIDVQTQEIKPIKAEDDEKCETSDKMDSFHVVEGQRRCLVVVPKVPLPGYPVIWKGYYFGHQSQAEVELLNRGFHVCYVFSNPDKTWDTWYNFMTEKHGLSGKPSFIGMSRGGSNSFAWGTANPDKVTCIYGDNTGSSRESIARLGDLVRADVPLLLINGSIDPILGNNALVIEKIYQMLGGRVTFMIQEGLSHHPHSLRDPKPVADFIEGCFRRTFVPTPSFVGENFTKSYFYGIDNIYRYFAPEKTYITLRGPFFTDCFNRFEFRIGGKLRVNVITPNKPAPGNPWVFRTDFVERDAVVDLALLAKGYYVVTGPVPTGTDGPLIEEWNTVYKYLTDKGFSRKPVMQGAGGATGEAYAWAIENPDKVSCIYGENPVIYSKMAKTQPIDNLAPLAKAGIPILHVCGSLDPWLNDNTRVVQKRYKALGGKITVIMKDGEGHYPLAPKDPAPVVDFIVKNTK
jgi:arabinoxylan arabinofuranohydrolase